MTKITRTTMLILLLMFPIIGCDDSGPTGPNSPFSSFFVDLTEAAQSFLATTTNTSTNHQAGSDNLSYLWEVQGQDDTNVEEPRYTFSYFDLGLLDVGDESLREFRLTVTEKDDPSRRATSERTILFQRTVAASVSAAIVTIHANIFGPFSPEGEIEAQAALEFCRGWCGYAVMDGIGYVYEVDRVLLGNLDVRQDVDRGN